MLEGSTQGIWLERLDHDYGNMREALQWLAAGRDVERALRLAVPLWRYWEIRGYLTEGRAWLAQLLSSSHTTIRQNTRVKALYAAGVLATCFAALRREPAIDSETAVGLSEREALLVSPVFLPT